MLDLFPASSMPDREWWEALWPDPEGVVVRLGLGGRRQVVDLCCGDGWFTAPLACVVEDEVIGVDLDADMLEAARIELGHLEAHRLILGDARELDRLLDGPVDGVLLANTLHGVSEPERLLAAVRRALETGGRLAIVNWYPRAREKTTVLHKPRGPRTELRMPPARVIELAEPAGFTCVDVVPVSPYHYGALLDAV